MIRWRGKRRADVTEAELALLQALWDQGPATIRQLADRVYGQGGASTYATVQKLLDRLESKGVVGRDRSESVQCFRAAIDREELIGRRLRAVADTLCGGVIDAAAQPPGPGRTALRGGAGGAPGARRAARSGTLRAGVEKGGSRGDVPACGRG